MSLKVRPPVAPMLARLERELPRDGYLYEPKWDGFRCLAFRDGDDVDLRSRNRRPLARYFPELVGALRTLPEDRFALDGEIVVPGDFETLLRRLHPAASRVERLSVETPASFIAFDVMANGGEDVRARPFVERRRLLEQLFANAEPPLLLTEVTDDERRAAEWLGAHTGIDGVVAKHRDLRYEPGARAMVKVKQERTADCRGSRVFSSAAVRPGSCRAPPRGGRRTCCRTGSRLRRNSCARWPTIKSTASA